MSGKVANMTYPDDYFAVGWFRFPIDFNENYELLEGFYNGVNIVSLLINPFLMWMIIKNPGSEKRANSSVLLGSLCLVNLIVNIIGFVRFLGSKIRPDGSNLITTKIEAVLMSVILPKYYASTLFLALLNYGVIVKPLQFKVYAPKTPRTILLITSLQWLCNTAAFVIAPFFVEDFDNYLKIMVTLVVSVCWFVTIVIIILYGQVLNTLRLRKYALERQFNISSSKQGAVVIKQNTRLAKALFSFIVIMVVFTLPLYTSYLVILHCPRCHQPGNIKFALYMTPIFMALPLVFGLHWILFTPQYFKEFKRLGRQVLVFCRILDKD